MKTFKTVQEILEYATKREEESAKMYFELSRRMLNPKLAQILEEFASEELTHKEAIKFEMIKNGQSIDLNEPMKFIEDSENQKQEDDDFELIDISFPDAFTLAIKKEEMSFRMYSELASKTKNPELKAVLEELAEEELRHKMQFEAAYAEITKDEEDF